MKEKICELVVDINLYLIKKYNYKIKVANLGISKNTIVASRKNFDLYLRYFEIDSNYYSKGTIVISRMYFLIKRKGEGTMFLKFLYDISSKYEITNIEIEQTNENSALFATKLGFKNNRENNYNIGMSELGIELKKRLLN